MEGRSYTPLGVQELIERLNVPGGHETLFKKALLSLVHDNCVETRDGRFFLKESKEQVVVGTLRMHPRGFGFLQPNDPVRYTQDIFIPKHLTKNAVDSDIVEVLINEEAFSEKGPEGRVLSIVKRSRTHVAGTVWKIEKDVPYVHVPLLGSSKIVIVTQLDERKLRLGDRIILKVVDWGQEGSPALCEMSHYIGNIDNPACDVLAALEEFNLRSDFPTAVLEEAKAYSPKVPASEIKKRKDLRSLETFTIDPDTAKDYDDALSLSKDARGHFFLGVHIADVSHYVRSASKLDEEAKLRCNSTYFPGVCIPMLPPELSNELCSLKANVARLTLSVLMEFDPTGTLLDYSIERTCIKSQKRFTYKEAKKVLEGGLQSKHEKTLHHMVELCGLLKKKRYERGSIEFALPDIVVIVDEKGEPQKMERIDYDITHQLVEEFMLKANEVVATYLAEKNEPLTYRVHDEPAEDSLKEFAQLARAFGFEVPKKPKLVDLQQLFEAASGTAHATQLATSFIRSMKLAYYSPNNVGHFGLSLQYYCHFTSPIRRYVDLIVHRIVMGETHPLESLSAACHACSEQERISAKAEQATTLLKKLRLLDKMHQMHPNKIYKAVVTRVKNMGIIFDLQDLMIDGFLHISELDNDYFIYDEKKVALMGKSTRITYSCGKEISLRLIDLDFITLESKWALVTSKKRKNS